VQSFNELWGLSPIASMAAAAGKNLLDAYGYAYFSDVGPRAVVSPAMPRNLGIEIGACF
jgi:hypothetical protein